MERTDYRYSMPWLREVLVLGVDHSRRASHLDVRVTVRDAVFAPCDCCPKVSCTSDTRWAVKLVVPGRAYIPKTGMELYESACSLSR